LANLASMYREKGRWKKAEGLGVQVIEARKRVLGEEHPDTLTSMSNLAHTWRSKSQSLNEEATSTMEMCSQLQGHILGPHHPGTEALREALNEWQMANPEIKF
ncbi:hypothetical protein GQ44DRAFT_628269, partial [Phaeosphaeriaceae sp. PMI808]